MTDRAAFTDDEWATLVRVPRWVVGAASAAETDNAARTHAEMEAGFIAVAGGRELGNPLVTEIAQASMGVFDNKGTADAVSFTDIDLGLSEVLNHVSATARLLRDKADAAESAAYKRWVVAITDTVISASRTGGGLGMGGVVISPAEKAFRDRVVLALQA